MAGNETSDDGKWETGDGLRDGIGEEKLIATLEVMLRLENVMCCVLWRLENVMSCVVCELRQILNAGVLRLEIWGRTRTAFDVSRLRMLASSGRMLTRLDRMAMHDNRLRYMTQMYTTRDRSGM